MSGDGDVEHDAASASRCYACDGCKYQYLQPAEVLPCGQHDKFAEQRKAMIVPLMIIAICNELGGDQ